MEEPQPIASSSKIPYSPSSPASKLSRGHASEVDEDDEALLREEEEEREEYENRIEDYLKLHESIKTSSTHLNTISSYLTTFQTDLADVSGQIAELQGRSREIDGKLKGRRTIARPLNTLITSLVIPPDLISTLRDTSPPGQNDAWIPAIQQLEDRIGAVRSRGKVRAGHEIGMVVEGLKAKAVQSLRLYLLSLIRPLRSSVRTNIQVTQTSILLKYLSFFQFLKRQAPRVADEVQRGYVVSGRAYYETCFRRYGRGLAVVKSRSVEPRDLLGTPTASEAAQAILTGRTSKLTSSSTSAITSNSAAGAGQMDKTPEEKRKERWERLRFARLEGEPVILGFMADDKTYIQPVEATFRSLLLVLLDNASAEFTFIVRFFSAPPSRTPGNSLAQSRSGSTVDLGVAGAGSPARSAVGLSRKDSMMSVSSYAGTRGSASPIVPEGLQLNVNVRAPETPSDSGRATPLPEQANLLLRRESAVTSMQRTKQTVRDAEGIWKQVMETAVDYCQTFFKSIIEPAAPPPLIPLLTMIRLNDAVLQEADNRGCSPMESICYGLKLTMWPMFQKELDAHIDSVKRLADAAAGGGFGALLAKAPKDATVRQVCERYAEFFTSIVALSGEEDEAMVFSGMGRLRNEVTRLVTLQSEKIKPIPQRNSFLLGIYDQIIKVITDGPGRPSHPKMQAELSFFRTRQEQLRRQSSNTR